MSDLLDVTLMTSAFVTLFVIMDPVGTVPIFLSLTGGRSKASARRAAWQAVTVSFVVIVVFAFFILDLDQSDHVGRLGTDSVVAKVY